jgi:hypothetical protein
LAGVDENASLGGKRKMTESDNSTPSVDDFKRSAQGDPEAARNLAAAAAQVAPEQTAAAFAKAAPDKAKDIAAGAAHTLSSEDKKDVAVGLAQTIPADTPEAKEVADEAVAPLPQVSKMSIATDTAVALSPDRKKDVVTEVLKTLPAEAARSIDSAELQQTMKDSNRRWISIVSISVTLLVLFTLIILVIITAFVSQEKEVAAAISQELLTVGITVAAAIGGYVVGKKV